MKIYTKDYSLNNQTIITNRIVTVKKKHKADLLQDLS